MKINNIPNINHDNNIKKIRHNHTVPNLQVMNSNHEKQKVFAYNLCFKSGLPSKALYNDYKWFINHDKIPAIDSLLKIEAAPEKINELLNKILENNEDSFELIDSIVKQPREANNIFNKLRAKVPSGSDITLFFIDNNPIRCAYKRFIENRYQNVTSPEELLKIRPDWSEEALLNVHNRNKKDSNFTLGKIPEDIGEDNFQGIIYHLRNYHQYGFKSSQKIEDLSINNRTFKFKSIIDGKTEKNVYEVELENGKKYVMKIADKEQASLESDSALGTSSKVDYYLTAHKCRNSAPFKYYDHNNNISVYDYIQHHSIPRFTSLMETASRMPDYTALGMKNCDNVGYNNFFVLNESQEALKDTYKFSDGIKSNNEIIAVDNDLIEYCNPMQPYIGWPLKELPGFNYLRNKMGS